jgi:hypothetical protein
MPQFNRPQNETLLRAALEGLELQRERIEQQITEVRRLLEGDSGRKRVRRPGKTAAAEKKEPTGRKRTLSASARKRIAAAQKRRWAEYRKGGAGAKEQ